MVKQILAALFILAVAVTNWGAVAFAQAQAGNSLNNELFFANGCATYVPSATPLNGAVCHDTGTGAVYYWVNGTGFVAVPSGGASTTQGIGGGAANTPGSDSVVNVKNYGAKGDGQIAYDGAMATNSTLTSGVLTSTDVSVANASGGNTVYTTAGAINFNGFGAVGKLVTVAGFTHTADNGTFAIVSTAPTTITLANASGVTEAAGQSVTFTIPRFASTDCNTGAGCTGATNKLICVEGATSTFVEQCGTITSFNSATSVGLSFSSAGSITAKEFRWGTDDKVAIQAAINALLQGGTVWFPAVAGFYASSDGFTLPARITVNLRGAGASAPYWLLANSSSTYLKCVNYTGGTTCNTTGIGHSLGSGIGFLSKSMTISGVTLSAASGQVSLQTLDTIEGLTLWAGVGTGADAGGSGINGISLVNWNHARIRNCIIAGWKGSGISISDTGTSSDWSGFNTIQGNWIFMNGANGIILAGSNNVQNTTINGQNEVESNTAQGLLANLGSTGGVLLVSDNVFQWNDTSNSAIAEVTIVGTCQGCTISSNWFETPEGNEHLFDDYSTTAASIVGANFVNNALESGGGTIHLGFDASHVVTQAMIGQNYGGCINSPSYYTSSVQFVSNACSGAFPTTFNVTTLAFGTIYSGSGGSAIPAAAAGNNHQRACVSDAAACTNGTTYAAGGGAVACEVYSNGTNWLESGSGC